MSERISEEDLKEIQALAEKKKNAFNVAQLSVKTTELEYENAVLQKFVKYGLKFGDTISQEGVIERKSEVVEDVKA